MTPTPPQSNHNEPTLAEDLMLLLFLPRSGTIAGESTLFYVLAGAVLAELALGGLVKVGEEPDTGHGRLRTVGARPPSDTMLGSAGEYLDEKPRRVQTVLTAMGPPLRAPVLDRPVERGHIDRTDRKVVLLRVHALSEGHNGRSRGTPR